MAYGSFQTRHWIGTTAPSLCHCHSYVGSKTCLRPIYHSSQQCQILNPLNKVRDWTHIFMNTSWVCYDWATMGIWSLTTVTGESQHCPLGLGRKACQSLLLRSSPQEMPRHSRNTGSGHFCPMWDLLNGHSLLWSPGVGWDLQICLTWSCFLSPLSVTDVIPPPPHEPLTFLPGSWCPLPRGRNQCCACFFPPRDAWLKHMEPPLDVVLRKSFEGRSVLRIIPGSYGCSFILSR